ncbi:choline dehydrogenase [Pyricularia oryzae]|nr:choline dehydrogenase [Pyricularia oryzae]
MLPTTGYKALLQGISALSLLALSASQASDAATYDYVVVGSGPGGGVVATNLAKAGYSVFLLEAGDASAAGGFGTYSPTVTWDFFVRHYPEGDPRNEQYSHLTWKTPEGKYWVGQTGAPAGSELLGVYYPRGATLGGSSMINAMAAWLPSDGDWDYHANVTGDDTWRADNMRKVFERMEKNNYLTRGAPGHGFDGYFQTQMGTRQQARLGPLAGNRVMEVYAQDLGLTQNMTELLTRDPNEPAADRDQTQSIYGLVSHQYANGTRYSSRDYIQEEARRPGSNLTVSVNSLATRVLFDTAGGCGGNNNNNNNKPRAVGVEYLEGASVYRADFRHSGSSAGTKKTVMARREVIVSGGAFNSPQILMLSGVGPRAHLESFNISVVADVPGVGQNLMDNQEMPIVGSGSAGTGTAGVAMVKSKHPAHGERDMFLMGGSGFLFRGFWPSENRVGDLPPEPSNVYGVSMVKGSSVNDKGWVKLRSADPRDPPEINFNHYAEGSGPDLEAMKDTIAWIRTVYKRIGITTIEPPCPAGADEDGYCGESDEAWLHKQTFGHHPTSTNRIGADDDPLAVLDSKFRVRGVAGLRVIDASAFARIPGVFPVVSTFIISEKASGEMVEELEAGIAIEECTM